ncbi:MAG: U32 family peptidase [Candidatus Cloacimonetes bacterium]|nr:U32 family peptidase [Candidatus Cloacimonadota bacterium]
MEILSPAGNLEKVKFAILYGADAVYAGSQDFSLRAKADNFTQEDLTEAVAFCHKHNKKLFVPLNIYAHNRHYHNMKDYVLQLMKAKIDAVIVSDLGVMDFVKSLAPEIPIHISTQANVCSINSVKAYQKLGAKRIILARELTFKEIIEIRQACPDIELEIFVHGAMCISYSGRCLLSAFFNNRSANLGECTQVCRWKYHLMEETRPNEFFPIDEDKHGFYFMNSKDLCLFNQLENIYKAGIDSVKIEGRMKSIYYISAITRAYKTKLNNIINNTKINNEFWNAELNNVSHRIYSEGFFNGFDENDTQNYESSTYIREYQFVGNIINIQENNNEIIATVKSYHKIETNDEIEIIFPDHTQDLIIKNITIYNEDLIEIPLSKPNTIFKLKFSKIKLPDFGIIRKKI